ncbi:MAG: hypothetical protein C0448_10975 [Sphingobacteriaceae bacterium]|nr:hypothetical protein [Sphingobacteriaceae bacterium]
MEKVGYPNAKANKKTIIFSDGEFCNLPTEYIKESNNKLLQEFYYNLLVLNNKDQNAIEIGTDPLGFAYFKIGFLCYVGLVVLIDSKDAFNYGSLKKKYPKNKFYKEYILKKIKFEYDLLNHKKYIPIDIVTQNLHEIRGLNSKISGHVDVMMNLNDESKWEEEFDKKPEQIKKIFVASRLIKFILDNTKFYIPDFFTNLKIKHDKEFIVHRSVSKIVKIYSNDFKKDKINIEFTGITYATITGEKEYFEILVKILIENALKYSLYPATFPPKINISEQKNDIIITASSYGDLITEDDLSHLFTKGFRSNANKNKQEGTGMGLYNASQLAKHYSAGISYSNKLVSDNENINIGWNVFTLKLTKTFLKNYNTIPV